MSLCSFRWFLALLLGVGVLGRFPASARAGDKIHFSRASESLALPTADQSESEPDDAFSFLPKSSDPQPQIYYPVITTPAPAPVRRNDDRNARNGSSGLNSELDVFGQNSDFENPSWEAGNPDYSYKPSSNDFNSMKAPGSLENRDRLDPGFDRLDPRLDSRYAQPNYRLDSLTPSERRDRLNDAAPGNTGRKSWTLRSEDAYGSANQTSLADLLGARGPNAARESKTGVFKPTSPFATSQSPYDSLSSSLAPPISLITAPLDATEAHDSIYKGSSAHSPSLGPVGSAEKKAGDGLPRGLPGLSVWGNAAETLPPAAPAHKPAASQSQMGPQRQQGGAVLPMPKKPGSVFNNN
jgi:hypothetical protein